MGSFPDNAALNAFALPRVESTSSLVAINDGHIYPELIFLQAAWPLHISIAWANPPSFSKERKVSIFSVL